MSGQTGVRFIYDTCSNISHRRIFTIMGLLTCIHAATSDDLLRFTGDPDALMDFFETAEDTVDLDKAWHAIHFLLTGSPSETIFPLGFILGGGFQLGGDDYDDVRYFTPEQVAIISSSLAEHPVEALLARYDGRAMGAADIYPSIWARPDEDSWATGYIRENYCGMASYISGLASRGCGMIVSIQ